jgi:N6-L-threonylcarbamoyladenine synthase
VTSILPTIQSTLSAAQVGPEDLAAIGVTRGPGLIGSLLVGLNAAAGLGAAWDVPVIGINHLRGHLRSADLDTGKTELPALVLLVSGGHSLLAHMKSRTEISILGTTRDDSVGEAFDKVARMLELGFPGGPALDQLAQSGSAHLEFPRPLLRDGLDFSFSGLKSAVARFVEKNTKETKEDIAASVIAACIDVIAAKTLRALQQVDVRSLVVVGGVAANSHLRTQLKDVARIQEVALRLPPLKWSTDNGAMIALAAWDYLEQDQRPPPIGQARLSLEEF